MFCGKHKGVKLLTVGGVMLRASVLSVLTAAGLSLCSFLTNVITARILGAEGRGAYAAVIMVAMLAAGLGQLGLGQAFVFRSRLYPGQKSPAVFLSFVVTAAVASIILAWLITVFNYQMLGEYIMTVLIMAAGLAIITLVGNMFQVQDDLVAFNIVRISLPIGILGFLAFCVEVNEAGVVESILIAQVTCAIAIAMGAVFFFLKLGLAGSAFHMQGFKDGLAFGLKYHATTVLGMVVGHIDKLVLLVVGSLTSFGIYSIAFASARILATVHESIANAFFSQNAGKMHAQESISGLLFAFRVSFYPLLVAAAALAVSSTFLMEFIFGDEFGAAALPFSILCFESVIGSASWLLAQYYNAVGRPGIVLLRQLISLIPIILFLIFLPESNVLMWLAFALLLGSLVRFITTVLFLRQDTGLSLRMMLPMQADFSRIWARFGYCADKKRR